MFGIVRSIYGSRLRLQVYLVVTCWIVSGMHCFSLLGMVCVAKTFFFAGLFICCFPLVMSEIFGNKLGKKHEKVIWPW